jgi:hypothetical protein
MADPATMMMAGAALGAATNRDDPMKGAMMGAALGGVGGGIASGAMGGAAGLEGASLLGAESLAVPASAGMSMPIMATPATMAEFMPMAQSVGGEVFASPTFDFDAIARASLGSDLPGASAVAGASPMAARMNPMMAMSAMNMLGGQQPQPVAGGGVKRGDPRLVQQDPIMSLLAPKRVEKRQISLL